MGVSVSKAMPLCLKRNVCFDRLSNFKWKHPVTVNNNFKGVLCCRFQGAEVPEFTTFGTVYISRRF